VIVGGIGLLASILALLDLYAALTPDVSATYADLVDPLSAPFRISNHSNLFWLYHVIPQCGIVRLTFEGGGGIDGMNLAVGIQSASISPRNSALYNCPLSTLGKPVKSADIVIFGQYQLGLPWRFRNRRFTFQSDQLHWQVGADRAPHWVSGTPVQ
jgi:hypothetical protein